VVIPAGVYETGPVDVPSDTRLVLEAAEDPASSSGPHCFRFIIPRM